MIPSSRAGVSSGREETLCVRRELLTSKSFLLGQGAGIVFAAYWINTI